MTAGPSNDNPQQRHDLREAMKEMQRSGAERLHMWTTKSGNVEYTMELLRLPEAEGDQLTPEALKARLTAVRKAHPKGETSE